jgi:cell division septation protein DedD
MRVRLLRALVALTATGASVGLAREARAVDACVAADVMNAEGCSGAGTCTITKTFKIGDGCVLDFGTRDVIVDGTVTIDEGTVVFKTGSFTVTRRGVITGNGRVGGSFTVFATGSILILRLQNQTGDIRMLGDDAGGTIVLDATGNIAVNGSLRADNRTAGASGGTITLRAGGDITVESHIAVAVSAHGGAQAGGGTVDLFAGGRIAVGRDIKEFTAAGGDGGLIRIHAGTDVVIDGKLTNSGDGSSGSGGGVNITAGRDVRVNAPIESKGVEGDAGGGNGGVITFATGRDLVVRSEVTTQSGRPDGGGGVIEADSRGSIDVQPAALLDAGGNGLESFAGEIRLSGDLDVAIGAELQASGGDAGGKIAVDAGRDVAVNALIDAGSRAFGGSGGSVAIRAGRLGSGDLVIAGDIDVSGTQCDDFNVCGVGGTADLAGCDLVLEFGAAVDASVVGIGPGAKGGGTILRARRQLTVNGRVDASASPMPGTNVIERRGDTSPLLAAGSVQPPPTDVVRTVCTGAPGDLPTCLTPCPACGNTPVAAVEFPETCDDGSPARSCDGCSLLCQLENCDDADVCTVDDCDPERGCRNTPLADGTPCPDATVCNGEERCVLGACVEGLPLDCDDGDDCTVDLCDPVAGCAHRAAAIGSPCDDGNVCTAGDACNAAGACAPGTSVACNDQEACTADSCNPTLGCVFDPLVGQPCAEDGNLCTLDVCFGTCTHLFRCTDDGNPCTTDACDPAIGCHQPIPGCGVTTTTTTVQPTTTTVTTTSTSIAPTTTTVPSSTSTTAPVTTTTQQATTTTTVPTTTTAPPTSTTTAPASTSTTAAPTTTSQHPPTTTPAASSSTTSSSLATTSTMSGATTTTSQAAVTTTTPPATATTTTLGPPIVGPACLLDADCNDGDACAKHRCIGGACARQHDAGACPVHTVAAKKLIVKAQSKPQKNNLLFISKGTFDALRPEDAPTQVGGALHLRDAAGQRVTFNLEAALWKSFGSKGFRYTDKKRSHGPCTNVTFKTGRRIDVACRGSQMTLLPPLQAPVELLLRIGNSTYCASFGGKIMQGTGKFVAKSAGAPVDCLLNLETW